MASKSGKQQTLVDVNRHNNKNDMAQAEVPQQQTEHNSIEPKNNAHKNNVIQANNDPKAKHHHYHHTASAPSSTDSGCIISGGHHTFILGDESTIVDPQQQFFIVDNVKDYYSNEAIDGISTSTSYWATKTCRPYHSIDIVAVQKTINNKQQFYLQTAQLQRAQQDLAAEGKKRASAWPFSASLVVGSSKASLSSRQSSSNEEGYATPPPPQEHVLPQQKNHQTRRIVSITVQLEPPESSVKPIVYEPAEMAQPNHLVCRRQQEIALVTSSIIELHENKIKKRSEAKSTKHEEVLYEQHETCANRNVKVHAVCDKSSQQQQKRQPPSNNTNRLSATGSSKPQEWTIQAVGNAMCITLAPPLPLPVESSADAASQMVTQHVGVDDNITITMPLGRRQAKVPPPPHQSGMNVVKMSNNVARANNVREHVSESDNNNNKIAFELPSNNSSSAVSSAPTSQAPTTTTASSDNDDNNEPEGESDEDELALFKRLYGMEQQRRDATTNYDDEDEADFEDDNEYGGDEHDNDDDEQQICSSNGGVVVNGATTMPIAMIAPKKLAKPWQGSPNAKELHNELLFNEKMGIDVLKTKRSEFKRILNKIRDTQHKRESVEKNKTDLERAFEKRTANGKQQQLIMTPDDKLNNGGSVFTDARMPGEQQQQDPRRKSSGSFDKQPEFIREFYQRRASHPKV